MKGELRQQLMSYAEDLNADMMHQEDQKVELDRHFRPNGIVQM